MKFFIYLVSFICTFCLGEGGISYDPNKAGRLGDKLLQLTKALWVAETYRIPFRYTPFMYSDKFKIHSHLPNSATFNTTIHEIKTEKEIKNRPANSLALISYYFKADSWQDPILVHTWKGLVDNDIFLEKLRTYIAPNFSLDLNLPSDRVAIAVHIRKGSGGDHPLYSDSVTRGFADKLWPFKFPPESYYIEQIQKLSKMFNHEKLYVYIFTDYLNPIALLSRIEKAVNLPNILFDCKKNGDYQANILKDFFEMTCFEVLLRGGSNFSQAVHLVGNFKLVVFPVRAEWHGNRMNVEVGIIDKR